MSMFLSGPLGGLTLPYMPTSLYDLDGGVMDWVQALPLVALTSLTICQGWDYLCCGMSVVTHLYSCYLVLYAIILLCCI